MSKKKSGRRVWRGVTTATASLLALSVCASTVVDGFRTDIDKFLGTKSTKLVTEDSDGTDLYTFKSDYTSTTELLHGIQDVGERMSEEGSVLLKNNGALPLTQDETQKITLLGFSSYYGKICGNYSLWSNLTIFWGCGTNLHRSPYNARNHEYYSEDAVLTSGQAVAFISGGKEYGVIIAPKHLAFNDTEINRTGVSVFMTEQQARENELRGTQASIEDAGALGIMTAFNRVGITAANAHTGLLKNILRGEWGFKGLESQDFIMNPNYAVLKEYALNGGTMTTFTGENTMAAVSEKFAYWTTENVGQDTELMSAIKQAMTWQAYALANSNALDGMASSTRLVSVRTWYDNALVAVQVVFAALTVLAAAMYVLNDRKSKKQ